MLKVKKFVEMELYHFLLGENGQNRGRNQGVDWYESENKMETDVLHKFFVVEKFSF